MYRWGRKREGDIYAFRFISLCQVVMHFSCVTRVDKLTNLRKIAFHSKVAPSFILVDLKSIFSLLQIETSMMDRLDREYGMRLN
jgi:hypothetical protein